MARKRKRRAARGSTRAKPVATLVAEAAETPEDLAAKQERFVAEFLVDLNATQAAVRAGYSPKTAQEQSSRLLSNVMVAEAVKQAMDKRALRTEITQDRVLHELAQLAFSNIEDYTLEPALGTVKLRDGASPQAMRAVSAIKHKIIPFGHGEFIHELELKLWDKPGTLKLAGRHVGLFPNTVEVTGAHGGPIEVKKVRLMSDDDLKAAVLALVGKL